MRGVWTALITPFQSSGSLDLPAFERLLDDQTRAGITGVIPCGTTGENATLGLTEKKSLIQTAIKKLKGSGVRVFAGTGSNNTAETIEFSRWASDEGVDGVLLVTPYYSKPSPAGLEAHYRAVADAISCEIMLYNVPSRTGLCMGAQLISALAAHPKIRSLKEATGNVTFASEVLDTLSRGGRKMDVLSGDDASYLPLLSVGAVGVVSVASNLFPRAMVSLQKAFDAGNISAARDIHQKYYPLFRDLFIESNPAPLKFALAKMGVCQNNLRLPLAQITQENADQLSASLKRCGIEKGKSL